MDTRQYYEPFKKSCWVRLLTEVFRSQIQFFAVYFSINMWNFTASSCGSTTILKVFCLFFFSCFLQFKKAGDQFNTNSFVWNKP